MLSVDKQAVGEQFQAPKPPSFEGLCAWGKVKQGHLVWRLQFLSFRWGTLVELKRHALDSEHGDSTCGSICQASGRNHDCSYRQERLSLQGLQKILGTGGSF